MFDAERSDIIQESDASDSLCASRKFMFIRFGPASVSRRHLTGGKIRFSLTFEMLTKNALFPVAIMFSVFWKY